MPGPFRLLIVTAQYFPAVGGSENQIRLLASEFKRRDLDVQVWTRRLSPASPTQETIDGLTVRRFGPVTGIRTGWAGKLERAAFVIGLYRRLRRDGRQFDVVFSNQLQYPASAAVLAQFVGGYATVARTATSGPISDLRHQARISKAQRDLFLRRLTRVVALGPVTEEECRVAGFSQDRIATISNAVLMDWAAGDSAQRETPVRALWLGNFRPEKRVDLALSAWTETSLQGTLVVVGDGIQRDRAKLLATQCRARKGEASVEMPGLLADPRSEILGCQIFVQSSDAEGMSNALLEAMAAGCAAVATDVGETRAVLGGQSAIEIGPGQFFEAPAGLLVRAGDVKGMAAALTALASLDLRKRLGAEARRRCVLSHGVDVVVDAYLRLFDAIRPKRGG